MCEPELVQKYESFTHGSTTLESSLHLNLTEHINAEIGLGTIKDTSSAQEWLRRSFLYRRISKNTGRYVAGPDNGKTWEEGLDAMLSRCISNLKQEELVQDVEDDGKRLSSTEFGDIMSKVRQIQPFQTSGL